MANLTLYLGSKAYSSWSLRAWLALEQTGAPFDEVVIPLDQPDTRERIARHSPSGRVPALRDGDLLVWDSLAIAEHLAERFPEAGLWPADAQVRAVARAVSAEMHSGFAALRRHLPMNLKRAPRERERPPEVEEDIARVRQIWERCRERFGDGGPFLFGRRSLADAMYAPVVTRFHTYRVPLDGACAEYARTVSGLPAMQRFVADARAEPWSSPTYDGI